MLTSRPTTGKLRVASNLLPQRDGSVCVRPGARQLVAGAVAAVVPWGNRLLLQQTSRLVLWDGDLHDLGPSGAVLDAAPFQALTDLGERENRLYLADGVRPLRYVALGADSYAVHHVINTVTDPVTNEPLDVPIPTAVECWGGRLWVSTGGNFVQHCQADGPAEWNPLWTIDCQGGDRDRVLALQKAGDMLLVGMGGAVWGVTGNSQFDFKRAALFDDGCAGVAAVTSDGVRAWWMGPAGVRNSTDNGAVSEPIEDWFRAGVEGSMVWDATRRLLLCSVNGRGLACEPTSGTWTEFTPHNCYGVWASEDAAGWFGSDGVWMLEPRVVPWENREGRTGLEAGAAVDLDLLGAVTTVGAVLETWPEIPNPHRRGRTLLVRSEFQFRAGWQAQVIYTACVDAQEQAAVWWNLSVPAAAWWDLPADAPAVADPLPCYREAVPRLAGASFVQRLQAVGALELVSFNFRYRGVA